MNIQTTTTTPITIQIISPALTTKAVMEITQLIDA